MKGCSLDKSVFVVNSSKIKHLMFSDNRIATGGLEIKNSLVKELFDFRQNQLNGNLEIRNSEINARLRFENNKMRSYDFIDTIFNKDIWWWAGKTDNIVFNRSTFNQKVKIEAVKINEHLTSVNDKFEDTFSVNLGSRSENTKLYGKIKSLTFIDSELKNSFEVNGHSSEVSHGINEIKLNFTSRLKGVFKFNQLAIYNTYLSGANYQADLHFNNVFIGNLSIDSFTNYSNLTFNSLQFIKKDYYLLRIMNSKLKNIEFSNFDFNSFKRITIHNADFSEIKCSNIQWFATAKVAIDNSDLKESWQERRELFMQLRAELNRHGNTTQARKFRRQELKAHHEYLKLTVCRLNLDRINVWTNKSNSFGENWLKPIGLAVLFSFAFYFLMVFTFDPDLNFSLSLKWSTTVKTFNAVFGQNLQLLPVLFNPAHTTDFASIYGKEINTNGWTYFWDLLQRISMSYFIYQTIVAFRKYTK